MNKTVAIVAGSVGVLILAGVIVYFMRGDTPGEDEYSTFGFTNDAVERPVNGRKENSYEYEEEGVGEYDSEFSEISYQDGEGEADGDGMLYERSIAGQFPVIPEPGGDSAGIGTQASSKSTARTANTSSGVGARTTTTDTSSDAPETFTLSIASPKAGDVIVNDDGCTDVSDGESCIPESIARVFWNYGDPIAKITLELFNESGTRVRTFQTKGANSGRYTWEYSPTISDGDYKIVATAYNTSGALLTTAETGYFEVTKSGNPSVGPSPTPGTSITCPPVPSKVRTYVRANLWSGECSGTTCLDQVQLRHYRYPETVQAGIWLSLGERCALTATAGSRTCPYAYSNYPNASDINTYSIMLRDPDPSNDPNEVGDRRFTAYLKPIIGPSRVNDAFDFSIPFRISSDEVGKKFDFIYSENYDGSIPGQYSISECEGDYSERAVVLENTDLFHIRTAILSTDPEDGLEGSLKKGSGPIGATPVLALRAGKTYYLNMRKLEMITSGPAVPSGYSCLRSESGTCLSPFIHTDSLHDSAIFDPALGRQFRTGSADDYNRFYRWKIFQYNFSRFPTEAELEADPFFHVPGESFKHYGLYNPACGEGTNAVLSRSLIAGVNDRLLNLDNTLLDSRCQPVCAAPGYVAEGNKCVKE